jgi:hypothetical protein
MTAIREPVLKPVSIVDLRPTQMTVGMREVKEKRKEMRARGAKKIGKFLGGHMIPVILGPNQRHYVIDHHHLALALHGEGLEQVLTTVVADLSALGQSEFWTFIDHRGWVYPYDDEGRRRDFSKIPKSITGLKDDPFRSVAGELRRAGGFAKDTTPFSEFLWADFFRRRIGRKLAESDFPKALKQAMKLAKSQETRHLPGWCGPSSDS